jgi:hypothetical protein
VGKKESGDDGDGVEVCKIGLVTEECKFELIGEEKDNEPEESCMAREDKVE